MTQQKGLIGIPHQQALAMTNKNFNWHKKWKRLENGRLQHLSGIEFVYDAALGWSPCVDTIKEFEAYELARGVPIHQIAERVMRLVKEASKLK